MLEMCRRDQWRIEDLDWSVPPRKLEPEDEVAICQYFTDMSGIELLAAALFEVQRDNARDPVLREIFDTFVIDEERHSRVALRLARHYDIHRYRRYELNPHLVRFRRHFVNAVKQLAPDIANVYITTGELLLDIALLRSLDDYVDDEMSHQAMRLINRDESRHIAIDFHMAEYYGSSEYHAWLATRPRKRWNEEASAWFALVGFLYHAQPFFRDVFFAPMDRVDPTGKRLLDAFKRIQLLGKKQGSGPERPFAKFLRILQMLFNHPLTGPIFGPAIARVMGVDPRVIRVLYTEEEVARVQRMSYDELAEETLRAKTLNGGPRRIRDAA
jgi:hypothetical protein